MSEFKRVFEQTPIASIRVRGDGTAVGAQMYSPSLPAGDYDLYIEPFDDMVEHAYAEGRRDEREAFIQSLTRELELAEGMAVMNNTAHNSSCAECIRTLLNKQGAA